MQKKILLSLLIFYLSGCVTTSVLQPTRQQPDIPGIYYRVEKGQTLWRISKMFNIDLQEIVNINHISDASSIEVNQLLFIPKIPRTQPEVQQFAAEDFIWPLKGKLISSFGQTFRNMLNKGINIQPYSDLSILAARSGKVIFSSGNFKEFGKTIIIDHGDGLSSVYARLAEVFVKAGDEVAKGTVIAKADSAGSGNKFVYLHFQIRKGHIAQNPLFYLPR